ncbi:MAG TPA: TauD/TfdA family dioxygenase [Alphaproteobacteria bacterium]|nr:TauD/TfdA family dioxygenase [Alphaproteobacteria bacterium]
MPFEVRKLTPHVGAEILGLDLAAPYDRATAEALRAAFREHHLLLIRQKDLAAEDQVRFAQVFGDIVIRGKYKVPPEEALTQYVSNSRADGILGDGEIEFHQDHTFYENPLKALILYGVEIPPSGSATKFRNINVMLDRLPEDLRRRAEGVKVLHLYDYEGDYTRWQDPAKASANSQRAWQPLVWTEPETGRKALWAIRVSAVDFEGVPYEEGRALVEELFEFAAGEEDLTYVHRWQPGDLVIWNNLMLQHAREPFTTGERRTLRRTPIV